MGKFIEYRGFFQCVSDAIRGNIEDPIISKVDEGIERIKARGNRPIYDTIQGALREVFAKVVASDDALSVQQALKVLELVSLCHNTKQTIPDHLEGVIEPLERQLLEEIAASSLIDLSDAQIKAEFSKIELLPDQIKEFLWVGIDRVRDIPKYDDFSVM